MQQIASEQWLRFIGWLDKIDIDKIKKHQSSVTACWFIGFVATAGALILLQTAITEQPSLLWFPLILIISAWVGVEVILHRLEWAGRKFRPRLWAWWTVAVILLGGIALFLLAHSITEIAFLNAVAQHSVLLPVDSSISTVEKLLLLVSLTPATKAAAFQLYIDALTFIALGVVAFLRPMPARWASFRRFQFFLMAIATLAGRPVTGDAYGALAGLSPSAALDVGRVILAPILLPFAGVITLAIIGLFVTVGVVIAFFVFVALPLIIYDIIAAREQVAHIRAQKKLGLEGYLRRFDAYLRHDRTPPLPDDSKGARFTSPDEIKAARRKDGFAFGHVDNKPLFLDTDKHVLLMASTRSGKGVTVIIPHLLRYAGSAFVLDPKGENARATGRQRAVLNGKVHYLDPFGISGLQQSRFNPLASFTPENMEANSKALAAALVLNQQRDHWSASGQQLLAAIILHVVTSPDFPADVKDLVTVRRLLLGAVKPTLQDMSTNEAAGGLVADLAASFLATPEKEFGSIISTAQRETEILDNPYIAACLSAAGDGQQVDFADWHRGTMSVFLCLSAPKFPVFNRWLRLVLTSALDEMTDQLTPPPKPVCFMLDELATLGHLGVIENAIGLAAGYGIQLVAVFQDIAQMKDLYKGRWASFIGNAGIRALFSLDDFDTARYWSDFMGGHMVDTLSQSQDIYGLTKGQTAGEAMRALLTPEQIMLRYSTDKMLVLKQGLRPIEAERVPYWGDRTLTGLWDDPRIRPAPVIAVQPAPLKPAAKDDVWSKGIFAEMEKDHSRQFGSNPPPVQGSYYGSQVVSVVTGPKLGDAAAPPK